MNHAQTRKLALDYLERIHGQQKRQEGKQPCFVCRRFQYVAELHHIFTRAEFADLFCHVHFLRGEGAEDVSLSVPRVWLCPTCHALSHLIEGPEKRRRQVLEDASIPDDERERLFSLRTTREQAITENMARMIAFSEQVEARAAAERARLEDLMGNPGYSQLSQALAGLVQRGVLRQYKITPLTPTSASVTVVVYEAHYSREIAGMLTRDMNRAVSAFGLVLESFDIGVAV